MAFTSKGHKAMVLVDDEAIALATNHKLNISGNILGERTKDDGDSPAAQADGYTWGMSSDNIVGTNEHVTKEHSIVDLLRTMLAMKKVEVVSDAITPATGKVPEGGWAAANDSTKFPITSGEAYIESLSISAGATGFATASVSFKGQGELS